MSINNTTITSAVALLDRSVVVSSATGFASGKKIIIDAEVMEVQQGYSSGTTIPVLRGRNGTATATHPANALISVGDALTDFNVTAVPGFGEAAVLPGAMPLNPIVSYTASGAIALPTSVGVSIVQLIGTSALAMTIVNPTDDLNGAIMIIIGSGKSASTIDFPDATGLSNAGSSYDTITFQNGGQCSLMMMAMNGAWVLLGVPITGTTTALSVAIA
jgi:hypothetical protein